MSDQLPPTYDEFEKAVKDLLFNKPGKSEIPEDYEPTEEELEQVYRIDPPPAEQDERDVLED